MSADLLIETGRMWASLGFFGKEWLFHLDGVTGPDEYTAVADDNVYTNLMARRNLTAAADAAERHPDRFRALGGSEAVGESGPELSAI